MLPKLQFDFQINSCGKDDPLIFANPVDVITTHNINKVKSSLNRIKLAINNGYYVAGYVSYEATYALYETKRTIDSDIPLLWFGVFKEPIDNHTVISNEKFTVGQWTMHEAEQTYIENVQSILQLIHHKHTEQVNYTVPFTAKFNGSTFPYYEQLKKAQGANFNAHLQFEQFDILSVSPEKFFSIKEDVVTVRPMKGTVERGKTFPEDENNLRWLQQSEKNKIENDLITDLMKNELEHIATNVTITDRYRIEKYPTVYQMTTALQGKLKTAVHPVDVLTALFPCGSITGVPKNKTIEIIAEKETENRNVYCGTIGYFTPKREAFFNVAIRTVTVHKNEQIARYHAGGAITEQSTPKEEYKELLAKTDVLNVKRMKFQLLETILLHNGKFYLMEQHINRLKQSAQYFNFVIDDLILVEKLHRLKKQYHSGKWRIRLLVNKDGDVSTEAFPMQAMNKNLVILAKEPIDKHNVFHYHKTTERTMFDKHQQLLANNHLDVLLWNKDREITEFTIGNVVVELNGKLMTPPVKSGLLPGTFRNQLIEDGIVEEAVISLDDLNNITSIWFINSVRKWIKVTLQR